MYLKIISILLSNTLEKKIVKKNPLPLSIMKGMAVAEPQAKHAEPPLLLSPRPVVSECFVPCLQYLSLEIFFFLYIVELQ